MTTYIESLREAIADRQRQIEERRKAIADATQQVVALEAEIRAYTDAMALHKRSDPDGVTARVEKAINRRESPRRRGRPPGKRKAKSRAKVVNLANATARMSPLWKTLFGEMARRHPGVLTNPEMVTLAEGAGLKFSHQALRQMLSAYTSRDWLERVRKGAYKITPVGATAAGLDIKTRAAEVNGGVRH